MSPLFLVAGCCKICLSLAPRKLEAPGWPSIPGQLSKLFCNGDILNHVTPSGEVTWLAPPWSEDVRQGGFLSILNWPKYYALQNKIFGHERDFLSRIVFSQKVMTYTEGSWKSVSYIRERSDCTSASRGLAWWNTSGQSCISWQLFLVPSFFFFFATIIKPVFPLDSI